MFVYVVTAKTEFKTEVSAVFKKPEAAKDFCDNMNTEFRGAIFMFEEQAIL